MSIDALQEGKRVWWQADMNCARYYAFRTGGYPLVHRIQQLESDPPTSTMFADVIILNRPDLHYRERDHRALIKHNFFRM